MLCSAKYRYEWQIFWRETVLFCVLPPGLQLLPLLPHRRLGALTPRCLLMAPQKPSSSFLHQQLETLLVTGEDRLGPLMALTCEGKSDYQDQLPVSWRKTPGNHSHNRCLLSLRAVAVHAPVRRLPAGLTGHPVPHLHGQPCLRAPLDRAAQLLTPCFCGDKSQVPIAPRCGAWLQAPHHHATPRSLKLVTCTKLPL